MPLTKLNTRIQSCPTFHPPVLKLQNLAKSLSSPSPSSLHYSHSYSHSHYCTYLHLHSYPTTLSLSTSCLALPCLACVGISPERETKELFFLLPSTCIAPFIHLGQFFAACGLQRTSQLLQQSFMRLPILLIIYYSP